MRSPYFRIAEVEVHGTQRVSPEEVIALTGVEPGLSIFSIRAQDVVKAVSGHPWIQDVDLARQLPDKVVLNITERDPFLLVPYRTSFFGSGPRWRSVSCAFHSIRTSFAFSNRIFSRRRSTPGPALAR